MTRQASSWCTARSGAKCQHCRTARCWRRALSAAATSTRCFGCQPQPDTVNLFAEHLETAASGCCTGGSGRALRASWHAPAGAPSRWPQGRWSSPDDFEWSLEPSGGARRSRAAGAAAACTRRGPQTQRTHKNGHPDPLSHSKYTSTNPRVSLGGGPTLGGHVGRHARRHPAPTPQHAMCGACPAPCTSPLPQFN